MSHFVLLFLLCYFMCNDLQLFLKFTVTICIKLQEQWTFLSFFYSSKEFRNFIKPCLSNVLYYNIWQMILMNFITRVYCLMKWTVLYTCTLPSMLTYFLQSCKFIFKILSYLLLHKCRVLWTRIYIGNCSSSRKWNFNCMLKRYLWHSYWSIYIGVVILKWH